MNVPRITKLSVGRLCNLGNYEHIRYEVTVDIPEGVCATKTLTAIETALNTLATRPPDGWSYRHAAETLAKPRGEWTPTDIQNEPAHREMVRRMEQWHAKQDYARKVLGDFSLSSEFTDHKQDWQDDDQPF